MTSVVTSDSVTANTQLILQERVARDLQLWDRLRGYYTDDAVIRNSWYNVASQALLREH